MDQVFLITLAAVGIYMLPGILWWCVVAYKCWYEGTPIRVEDLYSMPIIMLLWPAWIIQTLWEAWCNWCEQRKLNQDQHHVPFHKRVLIQGRLSARVEKALREDIK